MAVETAVDLDPDLGDGWAVDRDHGFVGMTATVDGHEETYELVAIWTYQGTPERLDLADDDGEVLNISRERVEVAG